MAINNDKIIPSLVWGQMNTYVTGLKLIRTPASESPSTYNATAEDKDTLFETKSTACYQGKDRYPCKKTTKSLNKSYHTRDETTWRYRSQRKCLEVA